MENQFSKGIMGEKEVSYLLTKALNCQILPYKGFDDKGFDLHLQMKRTTTLTEPLFLQVQVKTGYSFVKWVSNSLKVNKSALKDRIEDWKRANSPVLFIWLNDKNPSNALWHLITKSDSLDNIFLSRQNIITPTMPYDLTIKLAHKNEKKDNPIVADLFVGNLSNSFRNEAKSFYKRIIGKNIINPILGNTRISWHGWKHLTNQKRKTNHIFTSIRLLPNLVKLIEESTEIGGFRRINTIQRNNWIYKTRFVIFHKSIALKKTEPFEVALVLKEIIKYPVNWQNILEPYKDVERISLFESIYLLNKKNGAALL